MAKAYNSNWSVKPLSVNFNQKQWRQDFGAYVRDHLYWDAKVRVSRSRGIGKGPNLYTKGVKQFEVYNGVGGEVSVQYQNNNEVLYTTHEELLNKYFEERGFKQNGK